MPPTTILLIRHAEKPDPSRDIRGVDIQGHDNPAEPSVTGWQRSGALPRLFSPAQAAEMPPNPDIIFAAASHPRSAVQTLGLTVRDSYGSDDLETLVAAVRACDGVVMVCWRHESIVTIARAFVGDASPVPDWDAQRFDVDWVLSPSAGGWTLRQRPQLLLPGDRREPIKAS